MDRSEDHRELRHSLINLCFFGQQEAALMDIGFSSARHIGVLCIRCTLAEGRASGLFCGLGAATADAIYGWVAVFGLTFIISIFIGQQVWLRSIGDVFPCYLGLKTFLARPAEQVVLARGNRLLGAYASTFLMTLTNPMTILSFAAIFAGLNVVCPELMF